MTSMAYRKIDGTTPASAMVIPPIRLSVRLDDHRRLYAPTPCDTLIRGCSLAHRKVLVRHEESDGGDLRHLCQASRFALALPIFRKEGEL